MKGQVKINWKIYDSLNQGGQFSKLGTHNLKHWKMNLFKVRKRDSSNWEKRALSNSWLDKLGKDILKVL